MALASNVPWSYGGYPFKSPSTAQSLIDSVRFLIGDTDDTDKQLGDGEVIGLLAQNSNTPTNDGTQAGGTTFPVDNAYYDVYQAAIAACTVLAAQYTRLAGSMSVGDLSIAKGNIAKAYRDMAAGLRVQALRHGSPMPYAGGLKKSEGESDRSDDDLRRPQFWIGMDDNHDESPSITGGTEGFSQAVPSG